MIYVKFNYKAAWHFYGPWGEVAVHYNCPRKDDIDHPTTFQVREDEQTCVDEIFLQEESITKGYTVITGWEDGRYRAIALNGCSAYLLTPEGKTLERI